MTRRNDKRNERRERNHNHSSEQAAQGVATMMLGAYLMKKFLDTVSKDSDKTETPTPEEKPFNGIRKVSDNHIETGVIIPADGSAVELKFPENCEIFISDDGKTMIRKKVEGGEELAKECEVSAPITYKTIAKKLFIGKTAYYANGSDIDVLNSATSIHAFDLDNCTTEAQVKRLQAFNKLQNIAKYLNDGWTPNFDDDSPKYCITRCLGNISVAYNTHCNDSMAHFKTKELAEQAIEIMGEESLADLFNINW